MRQGVEGASHIECPFGNCHHFDLGFARGSAIALFLSPPDLIDAAQAQNPESPWGETRRISQSMDTSQDGYPAFLNCGQGLLFIP